MSIEYWYMLPVSILISTLAMASGIGGATFFSPLFMLAQGLPPSVAIGTGLITEVFGFASGVSAYARKRLIDYKLSSSLLMVTIPMAVLGSYLSGIINPNILKLILGVGLILIAISFFRIPNPEVVQYLDDAIRKDYGGEKAKRCIVTSEGKKICYTVCNRLEGSLIAGLGGLFVGMVSTGLGEMDEFFLMKRCRVPSRISIASSVFIVACTVLAASIVHFIRFSRMGGDTFSTVLNIIIFTIPGVIIGGQLGPRISSKIPQRVMVISLGVIFIIVAVITLLEAALK